MPLRMEERNGDLVCFITGELDHHNTLTLREKLDAAVGKTSAHRVVLDLSGTVFCDSSALGLILGRVRVAKARGIPLVVASPSPRVKKILDLCGAEKFLQFIGREEA
ncbi:MAG: STAS domain-containing protein [Clostridia bacterium]|nr:STAS domain-containing protein [Clostridia bacterium]